MQRIFSTALLAAAVAATAGATRSLAQNSPTFGNRTDKPDGSSTLTIGRSLPTPWDTRFGFDASLAPEPAPDATVLDGARRSTGAVWGSMTGPSVAPMIYDKTEFGARLNPADDQGRVSATMSRTVPLADGLSVTLRDEYAVTQSRSSTATETAHSGSAWSIDRSVRLSLGATGTTLSAGTATSSTGTQWHNRLSAEQQIVGPLSVQTSITDQGTGAFNKSITAGFKRNW